MDQRAAKRLAARYLAAHAENVAASIGRCLAEDQAWQGRSQVDSLRVRAALVELKDEMWRRSQGERKPKSHPVDPRQAALFDVEERDETRDHLVGE